MSNTIVKIEAQRSTYQAQDAASKTMTVAELINYLSYFDEDSPVILSHDNGYTFGSIHTYDIETIETDEDLAMRTFLLCNDQNGHTPVIESYTGKRNKTAYRFIAWIDKPGSYHKTLWTAHYDGTDHFFDSMEGCQESIAYFYEPEDIEFKQVDINFEFEMIWNR